MGHFCWSCNGLISTLWHSSLSIGGELEFASNPASPPASCSCSSVQESEALSWALDAALAAYFDRDLLALGVADKLAAALVDVAGRAGRLVHGPALLGSLAGADLS